MSKKKTTSHESDATHQSRVARLLEAASECSADSVLALWGSLYSVFTRGTMAGMVVVKGQNVALFKDRSVGDPKMRWYNARTEDEKKAIMAAYTTEKLTMIQFDEGGNVIKTFEVLPDGSCRMDKESADEWQNELPHGTVQRFEHEPHYKSAKK